MSLVSSIRFIFGIWLAPWSWWSCRKITGISRRRRWSWNCRGDSSWWGSTYRHDWTCCKLTTRRYPYYDSTVRTSLGIFGTGGICHRIIRWSYGCWWTSTWTTYTI